MSEDASNTLPSFLDRHAIGIWVAIWLLAMLMIAAAIAYWGWYWPQWRDLDSAQISSTAEDAASAQAQLELSPTAGLGVDRRLADGLAKAIRVGFQLGKRAPESVSVSWRATPLGDTGRQLIVQVAVDGVEKSYRGDAGHGFEELHDIVRRVGDDWPRYFLKLQEDRGADWAPPPPISDRSDWLYEIANAEYKLLEGPPLASDSWRLAFAWFTLSFNADDGVEHAHRLGRDTVAALLLASTADADVDPYLAGLTWLGLGYRDNALDALAMVDLRRHPDAQSLAAYARQDWRSLADAWTDPPMDAGLHGLLLARSLREAWFGGRANNVLGQLVDSDPTFLPVAREAMRKGGLGDARIARRSARYALVNEAVYAITLFAEQNTSNGLYLRTLGPSLKKLVQPEQADIWFLETMRGILTVADQHRYRGLIADPAWLRDWLQGEMFANLRAQFTLEYRRFAQREASQALIDHLTRIFPGTRLIHEFRMRQASYWHDYPTLSEELERSHGCESGMDIALTDIAALEDYQDRGLRYRAAALSRFSCLRRLLNPASDGLARLADAAYPLEYKQLERAIRLRRAEIGAGWAATLAAVRDGTLDLDRATLDQRYGEFPGYLRRQASHFRKSDPVAAETYLRRALALSPGDTRVGEKLARLLKAQGRPREAIEQLKTMLARGATDLRSAHLTLQLADLLDANGKPKQALKLYRQAAESYASDTLEGLAKAFERRGLINEAEHYWRINAERYPDDQQIALLAGFLIRHDHVDEAVQILHKDIKRHDIGYYQRIAFKAFAKQGQLERVNDFVRAVEGEERYASSSVQVSIAYTLAKMKRDDEAFAQYRALILQPGDVRVTYAHYHVNDYLDLLRKRRPAELDSRFQEVLSHLQKQGPRALMPLVTRLLGNGYYAQAYQVLAKLERGNYRPGLSLTFMALAWRMDGADALRRADIVARSQRRLSNWERLRIQYLLGELDDATLWNAVGDDDNRVCEAQLLVAAMQVANGDQDAARAHLLASLETTVTTGWKANIEALVAYDMLRTGPRIPIESAP